MCQPLTQGIDCPPHGLMAQDLHLLLLLPPTTRPPSPHPCLRVLFPEYLFFLLAVLSLVASNHGHDVLSQSEENTVCRVSALIPALLSLLLHACVCVPVTRELALTHLFPSSLSFLFPQKVLVELFS